MSVKSFALSYFYNTRCLFILKITIIYLVNIPKIITLTFTFIYKYFIATLNQKIIFIINLPQKKLNNYQNLLK